MLIIGEGAWSIYNLFVYLLLLLFTVYCCLLYSLLHSKRPTSVTYAVKSSGRVSLKEG